MSTPDDTNPATIYADDRDDFARLGKRTMDILSAYLHGLPKGDAEPVIPEAERDFLSNLALPEQGMAADDIISFMEEHLLPWPQPTGHPRSYGWVNSPPMPISIIAETVAQTMNTALDGYDFSGLFLMVSLSRWLTELAGFPEKNADGEDTMAILFSGGSAANLNALTTARYWAAKEDGWNMREEGLQSGHPVMVGYASDQVHSSVQRCVEQIGMGSNNLRAVPVDADYRMDVGALKQMIAADKQAGFRPTFVVASAGTTNVGAIDPFDAIADVCQAEGLWFHVDGAYGGFGALDPDYADRYRGLDRADTVTTDPHKWLQVPLDCGALLTQRKSLHREAFTLTPDYLRKGDEHGVPWPYEYMFQLTYANRAIKTWAAVARMGREGVRDLVIRCNQLAGYLDHTVEDAPDLELLAPTSLSVVNFRYVPQRKGKGADLDDDALNELNQRISVAIAKTGEAHIPTTKIGERVSLRACILHYENCKDDIDHLIAITRRLGGELSGELGGT